MFETNDYFRFRIEQTLEGESSSRDVIYSQLWSHYLGNDSYLELIFGEGAFYTVNITIGNHKAHNDWLEILIDCGLLGVISYIYYWCFFIRDWFQMKNNHIAYAMMGACLIYTIMRTFFSMSFSNMPFYICMIIGYCFASTQEESEYDLEEGPEVIGSI